MKKFILLIVGMGLLQSFQAQNWEVQIQRIGENHHIKNLKLKPNRPLSIGRLITDEDSLREYNYFEGHFLGGTDRSLQIKLQKVQTHKVFANGISHQSTIPGKFYLEDLAGDTDRLEIALVDIDFLKIKGSKAQHIAGDIVEPLIWISLFTLILSPLISYNFKKGELNADHYKYWALGSTLGLTVGFACVITINAFEGPTEFQFKEGWPSKKSKLWRFDDPQ
jgi:hypothetical protein